MLEAIYAAYDLGRDEAAGIDPRSQGLADEAVWLARVIRERLARGAGGPRLLALMLFCEARRAARRSSDGRFVPLSEQDPAAWSTSAIREAEAELGAAARMGRIGRFQLEAAIQSVHVDRAQTGRTDWEAIVGFYEHLVRLAPTLGARVAQAAAVAEARGTAAGLALLDTIDRAAVVDVSALLGRARAPLAAGGRRPPARRRRTTARSASPRTRRPGSSCSNGEAEL